MVRRARRALAVVSLAALPGLLAACGSTPAAARHVVGSPAAPGYPSQGTVTPAAGTDPLSSPAAEQAVSDLQSDLGALDNGLAQINTDLNSPQADS